MPSKRSLDESRASISSAINFCDSTGSELVVSDNSGSSEKSKMWNQIPLPFMKYLSNKKSRSRVLKALSEAIIAYVRERSKI